MGKTILLADDSVTIQKVVELTFMEEDLEVITVGTGSEAIERLKDIAPDLVIADIHMPGADGFEVCRAVKADRPEVPVLLLVGTFEPFEPDDVTAAGAEAHLKKPFDSQELIRIVDRLLEAGAPDADAEDATSEAKPAAVSKPAAEPAGGPVDLAAEAEALFARPFEVASDEEGQEAAADGPAADSEPEEPTRADDAAPARLSEEDVERVARKLVELLGPETVREVAWEVVPDLAEVVIKDRLRELESQVE